MNANSVTRLMILALVFANPIPAAEPESAATGSTALTASERAQELHFVKDVLPVLRTKCFACHGDDVNDLRGKLSVKSLPELLKGGESGEAAIVPGQPDESLLYLAITRTSNVVSPMPPKDNDALNELQREAIHKWIEQGAIWPSKEVIRRIIEEHQENWDREKGVTVATSGGLSAEWTNRRYQPEDLWAYQPLRKHPQGMRQSGSVSPIDQLIDRRLNEIGLHPAKRADRWTLIRRATFDLTGLPPTAEEITQYLNDPAEEQAAFKKVVERLLASPHYGEQWGRHWLDVTRYADSSGFANDYERGNAWRYRDYVVRAFNEDKPYDRFILEQIAGDELDSTQPENLIAVGFLRMGPWELTGMEVAKVARQRFLDDVTDSVGQTFLGQMLQCAKCHDHKFDPIPTRDYYSIQAVFATTQLAERHVDYLAAENRSDFSEKKYLDQRKQHYTQTLSALEKKQTLAAARDWYQQEQKDSQFFEECVADLTVQRGREELVTFKDVRGSLQKKGVDPSLIPPRHIGFEPVDFGMERVARKGLERLQWRFERYEPYALSVYNGTTLSLKSVSAPQRIPSDPRVSGALEQSFILTGGDPFSPSLPVSPGILSAVGTIDFIPISESHSKLDPVFDRRLDLARWIASPYNPLTPRVIVNRVWQWHFNKALAGNPNNFGATGQKPTHPELLDSLARTLIDEGWSIKNLHRHIMQSDAYCRATQHDDREMLERLDPSRENYAVFLPRRLSAEEIRDASLATSGELNRTLGGIPVRPEMNAEAALQPRQVMGTFAEAWQPSPLPKQRHRRSLYALKIRGERDPFMEVFNAPGADLSCEQRESSTITPQVFALWNNEQTYLRGIAIAHSVLERAPQAEMEPVLDMLFLRILGRSPTELEVATCRAHWDRMTKRHQSLTIPDRDFPLEVLREAVEENTGEKFSFTEPLEFYRDFVPDLQPSQVDPRTRGLAEVCLVLLNSNEFLYVY